MGYVNYEAIAAEVKRGYARSVSIHGDWSDYKALKVFFVVASEFVELLRAVMRRDHDGQHGITNELRDCAVVTTKALLWYRQRRG